MTPEIVTALLLVGLCAAEWRVRRRSLRTLALGLALLVTFFTGPDVTTARRAAMSVPEQDRVRVFWSDTLSPYMTGVVITSEKMGEQMIRNLPLRTLAFGVLVWLAFTPVLREPRGPRTERPSASDGAG